MNKQEQYSESSPTSWQLRQAATKALFAGEFKQAAQMAVMHQEVRAREEALKAADMKNNYQRYFESI